jgi:glycosyltransferase involved in cell wall biosynthesis
MADIIFADTTRGYDGRSLNSRPLGATESSVIYLARELARRRHKVTVFTHCERAIEDEGVTWRPLSSPPPAACELYVAVQHTELLGFVRHAKRRALWVLWQPNHLEQYKRILRMWWYRPIPVLSSLHQSRIYAPFPPHLDGRHPHSLPTGKRWIDQLSGPHPMRNLRRLAEVWAAALILPRRDPHIVIPLGLPGDVRGRPPLEATPGRRAIFASNPVRNLRRLAEIWAASILPRVPDAVLDVFGIHDIAAGEGWRAWEGSLLPPNMPDQVKASIHVHPTAARATLIDAMRSSRVMLYLGHECEAFCMTLAEAQALGTPAVIAPVAALPERVIDGVTGFHRADPDQFAEAAVALLTDEALWRRQHEASLRLQQGITWAEQAARFEAALLGDALPICGSAAEPALAKQAGAGDPKPQ